MKLDANYGGDSRHRVEMEDTLVQLIATSPRYQVGKPYLARQRLARER